MRNYKANNVPKYKEDASKELYSYSKKNESLDNSHLWFVSESIHRLSHTFTLKEYTKYDIIKNVLIIIISKKRGKVNVRISIQWI